MTDPNAEAERIAERVIKTLCKVNNCTDPFLNIGALKKAIIQAEARGLEQAAKVAESYEYVQKEYDSWGYMTDVARKGCQPIAEAIRNLNEKEEG